MQFYQSGAHLEVGRGGRDVPGEDYLVKFTGVYKMSGGCFGSEIVGFKARLA